MVASNAKELKSCCEAAKLEDNETEIKGIDCTGEAFLYMTETSIIAPDIMPSEWTKKKIITLYNESESKTDLYTLKSLGSKRLDRIILEISKLIKS